MLYTPHARVFLSAVPLFTGGAISGFIEVEDPASAKRAWEFAERDQARADALAANGGVAPASRISRILRRRPARAAA